MLGIRSSRGTSSNITPTTGNTATSSAVAAETECGRITLPAGALMNKSLQLTVGVSAANNLASARTWKVKYGSTVLAQWSNAGGSSASAFHALITDRGNNTQRGHSLGGTGSTAGANSYTGAVDTSAAVDIVITVTMGAFAAGDTATLEMYTAELFAS